MMFHTIVWKWYDVTGGDDGLMGMPNPDISLFGWNLAKRRRLILAGADLLVPDFSQYAALSGLLGIL